MLKLLTDTDKLEIMLYNEISDIGVPIGTICSAFNINPRTLRIYDKEGILCPQRTDKNRRYYKSNDIEKLKSILFLSRNLAVNLSGIKIIFSILEKNKIPIKNYIEYLNIIAELVKIDLAHQKQNIAKNSKKGRKTIKLSNKI